MRIKRKELCAHCGAETGKAGAGEDSIFIGEIGPLCDACYDAAKASILEGCGLAENMPECIKVLEAKIVAVDDALGEPCMSKLVDANMSNTLENRVLLLKDERDKAIKQAESDRHSHMCLRTENGVLHERLDGADKRADEFKADRDAAQQECERLKAHIKPMTQSRHLDIMAEAHDWIENGWPSKKQFHDMPRYVFELCKEVSRHKRARECADALADAVTDVVYTLMDDGEIDVCDGPLHDTLAAYRKACEGHDLAQADSIQAPAKPTPEEMSTTLDRFEEAGQKAWGDVPDAAAWVQEQRGGEAPKTPDRESLGRRVREIWIAWAMEQPNPKPSWLVPWDELDEPSKEVDRRIGETIQREQQGGNNAPDVIALQEKAIDLGNNLLACQIGSMMTALDRNILGACLRKALPLLSDAEREIAQKALDESELSEPARTWESFIILKDSVPTWIYDNATEARNYHARLSIGAPTRYEFMPVFVIERPRP